MQPTAATGVEFEVEKIMGRRARGRGDGSQYLVVWKGFNRDAATWEPEDTLPPAFVYKYELGQQQDDHPTWPSHPMRAPLLDDSKHGWRMQTAIALLKDQPPKYNRRQTSDDSYNPTKPNEAARRGWKAGVSNKGPHAKCGLLPHTPRPACLCRHSHTHGHGCTSTRQGG